MLVNTKEMFSREVLQSATISALFIQQPQLPLLLLLWEGVVKTAGEDSPACSDGDMQSFRLA